MLNRNKKSQGARLLLFILALCFMALAGCGTSSPTPQVSRAETITVQDCMGRKVAVPVRIERIACMCPEAGHAMAMLGQADKIVAVVEGVKRDVLLTQMYPAIKNLSAPKTSGVINVEELVKYRPDVIFIKADTANNQGEVQKLNKIKIPYLVVDYNNISGQLAAMDMMGKVVGAEKKAQEYRNYYQERLTMVQKRVAQIPPEQRVRLYHSINEATRTDVKGSLPAEWTKVAGAVNVSVNDKLKLYEGKYFASLEQILLWNPEVIIVNDPNVVGYIKNNKQWSPLQAVKFGKVWAIPNGISRWGHPSSLETPLAVLWTAQKLYPEKFKDVDMVAEIQYFYQHFFNYQVSDELAMRILKGEGMRESK